MTPANREELAVQLVEHEGLRLKPYLDTVNKITIGVGRNLTDRGITELEARYLLGNDIAIVEGELDATLPWWRELDEVRQRVLADLCFNLGFGKLLTFVTTLGHMKQGRYDETAEAMLQSRWAQQVGRRATRLAEMMRTGKDVAR